jgi:iron complex outermembrane receptor protein
MNKIYFIAIFLLQSIIAFCQTINFQASIFDEEHQEPLIGATLLFEETNQGSVTDLDGNIIIENVALGQHEVFISYIGYESVDTVINLTFDSGPFIFELHEETEELDEITIMATRSTRTIKNIPTRVEFINAEELEEKAIMNAANISLVLRESTGIQIQQTSLSSGNSSIRIQGLDGRYTQLLKDGFPLYGGFSGGLSIMQIPPLDLAQFEIIKGSSSTLYGGGAIAGLVNMVSKQPKSEPELDILLAQTHTGGSTANIFYSKRQDKVGFTLYGAAHHNTPYNPDDDSFTNIPKTTTFSLNPKIFYYPNERSTLWFGVNATTDSREGGDIEVVNNGANSEHSYFENNYSDRINSQLVYQSSISDNQKIEFKNSVGYFNRETNLPDYDFAGDEINSFTELNYSKSMDKSDWILGANFYTSTFKESIEVEPRDLNQQTIGLFINNITDISETLALESGFRTDYSTDWGFFPLPRVSLLWKASNKITTRVGGGLGYKLPDMFTEEAATLNFQGILPINKETINAEKSFGVNLDLNYRTSITDELSVSINQLFYTTQISNALLLQPNADNTFTFVNAPEQVQSIGLETNVKFSFRDFRWFINYAHINTSLNYLAGSPQKPLTPIHNAGTVLMYENEEWRIGYEAYYTGSQFLSDGSSTSDFFTMGFLAQKHFDWGSPYINFENFTDTRQSGFSSEVKGSVLNPVFQEIYAPTDGFVFTVGIHLKPFGRDHDHHH